MKRLLLLRHAEARGFDSGPDRERSLTDDGANDAAALGLLIKKQNYTPDYIFCSPAKRTQQTLEQLFLEGVKTQKPEPLYNSPCGDLLNFIQETNDDVQTLMVIAHNPGIYQLAAMLAAEGDNDSLTRLMSGGYRPATLSVLNLGADKWSAIQPGDNELIDLIEPQRLS